MEYIKELEKQLESIKLDKQKHVIANRWEVAAACRDIEVLLENMLERAKEKLKPRRHDTNRSK